MDSEPGETQHNTEEAEWPPSRLFWLLSSCLPLESSYIRMRKVLHREAPRQHDQPQLNAELVASGLATRGKQTVFKFMLSDRLAAIGN